MSDQPHNAQDLALRASELPDADRDAYLDEVCGDDAELRAAVERALQVRDNPIAQAATCLDTNELPDPPMARISERLPEKIGHFSIRRVIGSGGMGTVYEAVQESPRRKVAVKVMKRGVTSRSALRRFQLESQVLGRLHHPGIAQIYEAGTWDDGTGGVPFFAMEFITGAKTLVEFAADKQLDTKGKVELFEKICDAVHHGHQKGIIHRDLKPGNILVDRRGHPKVIDFGVARSTDSDMAVTTQQTDVGALIGTLQYMSPEQCEADPELIDIRSDVYALGVILYELLCGKSPYDLGSMAIYDAVKVVREQPATRLSVVNPILRGDLETIVAKALAKDPEYRYQSALNLRQDLQRYLKGEAIAARPLSLTYQLTLIVRRHRGAVVAAMAIAAVLVIATALSIVLAVRASEAEERAVQAQALTEAELAKARVGQAFQRDILSMSSPRNAQGRKLTTQQILIEAARGIDERFEGLPELAAETRLMLGELMSELQMFDEADRQLNNAIAAIEARQGKDDPRVIRAMALLGRLWTEQGHASEADQVSAEALVRAKRALPEDDPVLIEALASRTLTLEFLTRHDEGTETAKQWLDSARRQFDEEHVITIEAMAVCGRMLLHSGSLRALTDPVEGKRMQEEGYGLVDAAAEIGYAELGSKHPVTLQAQAMYVFVDWTRLYMHAMDDRGSDEEEEAADKARVAEQLLVDVTKDVQAVLGEDHTFALDLMRQHGRCLVQTSIMGGPKRVPAAQLLLERAREGYIRRVGSGHPLIRTVEVDLSQVRAYLTGEEMGVEELRTAYERLLEIHEEDHLDVLRARVMFAVALLQDQNLEEGEPLMRVSIDRIADLLGPVHRQVVGLSGILIRRLIEEGQVERGIAEGEALLAKARQEYEVSDPDYIALMSNIGDGYGAEGAIDPALAMHKQAADAAVEHLLENSTARADARAGYVHVLLATGQPGEALGILDDLVSDYDSNEEPDTFLLLILDLSRVEALAQLHKEQEAREAFEILLEGNDSPPNDGSPEWVLKVISQAVNAKFTTLIDLLGDAMVERALLAHDHLQAEGVVSPEDEDLQSAWILGKLHHFRGQFAEAVRWQETAVEFALPEDRIKAQKKLKEYQDALVGSSDTSEKT